MLYFRDVEGPQNGANGSNEGDANGETSSRTSTPPKAGNGPGSTNDGDSVSLIEEKIEIYCSSHVSYLPSTHNKINRSIVITIKS